MNLRAFSWLKGKHAKLPPSQASRWATKDLTHDDLMQIINSSYAQTVGTLLHAYAEDNINTRTKMIKSDRKEVRKHLLKNHIPETIIQEYIDRCYDNLMTYVNDAIGYRMEAEVEIAYSSIPIKDLKQLGIDPPCFGTADTMSFRDNFLRISDLKTGVKPAHMEQLLTYAALFCLSRDIKPGTIDIELSIYQNNEVIVYRPEVDEIVPVMDRIKTYDKWLLDYIAGEDLLNGLGFIN